MEGIGQTEVAYCYRHIEVAMMLGEALGVV